MAVGRGQKVTAGNYAWPGRCFKYGNSTRYEGVASWHLLAGSSSANLGLQTHLPRRINRHDFVVLVRSTHRNGYDVTRAPAHQSAAKR